ncbi:membrane peptidoglycan carboxypeptidase [Kineococcus xinjiangensis]|uniref:Membrane peptidoglycan carboxypeptidase n=1 Tax=Kineococcus xinjiangensis TaxID=512762 RepID=A0A2S6ISH3_9ACTN|nr:transglycosylase domain-containing protein [Kineococcus xinjiangensis]PPK97202.1 membrane peptidoglycan carboxypeptidase [Kineococcus xinjiangensis]
MRLAGLRLLVAFAGISVVAGVLVAGLLVPPVAAAGLLTREGVDVFEALPAALSDERVPEPTSILYADGTLMARIYDQDRIVVPLEDIAPVMREAILAIEDARFYDHGPVDVRGIGRALVNNAAGSGTQGASTLTQQYVKNVLVQDAVARGDRASAEEAVASEGAEGYARKLREMKMAVGVEKRMSKDEILAGYLNIVFFANNVYGVEAASQFYFGKSARDLVLPEAALLAGMVQSPSQYDPLDDPAAARERRDVVLRRMAEVGFIDEAARDAATAAPVALDVQRSRRGCIGAGSAAYFCDYVTRILLRDPAFGATEEERRRTLRAGGLEVTTTLDPRVQQATADAVHRGVAPGQPVRAAASVVEPGTGRILAMAQNTTFSPDDSQPGVTVLNYNVDKAHGGGSGFQTGSAFKVFTLVEWLRSGRSLEDVIHATERGDDAFADFTACGRPMRGGRYTYGNAESGESGAMTVREATRLSVNTAYVQMEKQLDLCAIAGTAQDLGVTLAAPTVKVEGQPANTDLHVFPALTLGVNEVSPLSMAGAYAAFAADGTHCRPVAVSAVRDRDGRPLPVPDAGCTQALDPAVARAVTSALTDVVATGTGRAAALDRPVAGKTGTTNASTDVWFVGYTSQLSAAVWVGHAAGSRSLNGEAINGVVRERVYGGTLPAPIWRDAVGGASAALGLPVQPFPAPPPPEPALLPEPALPPESVQLPDPAEPALPPESVQLPDPAEPALPPESVQLPPPPSP